MHKIPELYDRFAEWWPLVSPYEEYEDDAEAYAMILRDACGHVPESVLELGSGGGNNAFYLKQHFRMTLVDVSPAMLAVSRKLNPECEHRQGDMRTLRLKRRFDAVFIHDAILYMRSRADLKKAMKTAWHHCLPGGVALFVPDYTRETFRDSTAHGGYDGRNRSLRYLQWDHDPDPSDTVYNADFAFLLKEGNKPVQVAKDTHLCGLFSIEEWLACLEETGFEADSVTLESEDLEPGFYRVFLGRKN